jgi:hypothetical protein
MKQRIRGRTFTSPDELFEALKQEWTTSHSDLIERICQRFKAKLETCLELDGRSLTAHWKRVHEIQHDPVNTNSVKSLKDDRNELE